MILLRNMMKEEHNKKMTFLLHNIKSIDVGKQFTHPCVVKIKLTPQQFTQFVNGGQIHFQKQFIVLPNKPLAIM